MIDTRYLLPPDAGPGSNPVLYGVAEAIAELLPVAAPMMRLCDGAFPGARSVEPIEAPTEGVIDA